MTIHLYIINTSVILSALLHLTYLSLVSSNGNGNNEAGAPAPVVIPASYTHNVTMIFLHGLGNTGNETAVTAINIRRPHFKVICPTSDIIPVTWKEGKKMHAWYDIKDLDHIDDDTAGIKKSTKYIHKLIKEEIQNGIPANRILLGGFSQGARMAVLAAEKYPQKLGGVISFTPLKPEIGTAKMPSNSIPYKEFWGEQNKTEAECVIPYDFTFKSEHGESCPISVDEIIDLKGFYLKHFP